MNDLQELVDRVERDAFEGLARRYHRVRHSSHDDAIVADCVGSDLRCAHDWGWCEGIMDAPRSGTLYTPDDLVEELATRAEEHGTGTVRLSGMEPVMEDDHLLAVADRLPSGVGLRIDTNGMLLSREYLDELYRRHTDLAVRLSFKGHDPDSFSRLAGVGPEAFDRQLRAFDALMVSEVDASFVLAGVYRERERQRLEDELCERSGKEIELVLEDLRLCPEIVANCEERGIDISHVMG